MYLYISSPMSSSSVLALPLTQPWPSFRSSCGSLYANTSDENITTQPTAAWPLSRETCLEELPTLSAAELERLENVLNI